MNETIFDALYDRDVKAVLKMLERTPEQATSVRLDDGVTPLFLACETAQPELVRALLAAGADPNEGAIDGETPLHVAAFEQADECVNLLLESSANPNSRTAEGKTPIMNASQGGSVQVVQALIAAGADLNAADSAGRSALHWAVLGAHDDGAIMRLLLSNGANPRRRNANGDSALDYARMMRKRKLTDILVKG